MAVKDLESLIEFRAEQLAYLMLARRDDLSVTREQRLGGLQIDLAATILKDGAETGQLFAVEAKGVRSQVQLRKFKNSDILLDNSPFPFLLFVFNMEDDKGYWRWVVEPVSNALRIPQTEDLEPLTNEVVAGIVAKVRHWYAARLAPQSSGNSQRLST